MNLDDQCGAVRVQLPLRARIVEQCGYNHRAPVAYGASYTTSSQPGVGRVFEVVVAIGTDRGDLPQMLDVGLAMRASACLPAVSAAPVDKPTYFSLALSASDDALSIVLTYDEYY